MIFFFFQNKSQGIYFALFSIRTYLGKKDHQLFHEQPMNQNGYRKVLLFYRLLSLEQMFSVTLTEQLHPPIRKEWTCLWICGRCPCWSLEHCLGSWAPTLFLC